MTTSKKLIPNRNPISEIAQDIRSARLLPGFTSGLVVGVIEVIIAIFLPR
jgi:hypothetical protein